MGRFWMRRNNSGVLLEECPAFPEALGNDVTARETYARRLTQGGVGESVNGQEDLKRLDDGSLTASSERNNRAFAHPFVSSQKDNDGSANSATSGFIRRASSARKGRKANSVRRGRR